MRKRRFDPYRDSLVVEQQTLWPSEFSNLPNEDREQISHRLHADAVHAAKYKYLRLYTGFARQITVTPRDVRRIRQQQQTASRSP